MRLFSLTPTEHAPHDVHLSDGPEQFFSFFANDVVCQAAAGRLPREQVRNKLFPDLLKMNTKLLGVLTWMTISPACRAQRGVYQQYYISDHCKRLITVGLT